MSSSSQKSPVSFAPVVYEHAASFVEASCFQVSRDAELLFQAHARAYDCYRQSPITVGIDVYNIEAEAYGAAVTETGFRDVPSILKSILDEPAEILELPDWDVLNGSRFGLAFTAAARLHGTYPEADVRIPLGGPFSIAANLLGFDNLLCASLTDPDILAKALLFLAKKQLDVVREAHRQGFGLSFFESAAAPPLLSPDLFRALELPALALYSDGYRSIYGTSPALIIGGDTVRVIDEILSLKPSFLICPAETDQRAFMLALSKHPEIAVRINMRAEVLAQGTDMEAKAEAQRVAVLARETQTAGRKLLVGTGVLGLDIDPERVALLRSVVEEI